MILWEGKSLIDGKPIVAIATIGSDNSKTGDMIQTWIIRTDVAPHDAVRTGDDRSICGDCPQRRFLGGACYVTPHQAPLSVYRKYAAGGYSYDDPKVKAKLATTPLRMGSYGDPAAVPFYVWEALVAEGCRRWTGYTHQWRDPRVQEYRQLLMASCDGEADAVDARALGWRYFLVLPVDVEGATLPERTVECLSDAQGMTCRDCGICDGTRADSRLQAASVAIKVHGALSTRFALNVLR